MLTQLAGREADQMEADGVEPGGTWVRTAALVGPQIPLDAARVVKEAVEKLLADAGISQDQPWRALELMAADYLPAVDQ